LLTYYFKFFSHTLDNILLLFAAIYVKKNLSWFLLNDGISANAAKKLPEQVNHLIKAIAKHSMEICEGFGIPKHTVHAPIYTGYEKYYKSDITGGEHYDVPLRPKF
jgi:hypothetical protein